MKNRAKGNHGTLGVVGLALAAAAFSTQSLAQSQCSANMGTSTDPNTTVAPLQFTGYPDFMELVTITLTPGAGGNSANLTMSEVDYALACADNDDDVPCTNGNDQGETSGSVPVEFAGNVSGTCGATDSDAITDPADLGPGTVRFVFPQPQTFGAGQGCTVIFDVRVRDRGTDSTPDELTGAAEAMGECFDGSLQGTGQGSVSIFMEDAPPEEPPVSVPGPQGWWLVVMAALLLAPAVSRIARLQV